MDMWLEFLSSPKARFTLQYRDSFGNHPWNAHSACKCLGKCSYNAYESLDLDKQCVYEDNADRAFILFPDLEPFADAAPRRKYDPKKPDLPPYFPGGALQRYVLGGDRSPGDEHPRPRENGTHKGSVYSTFDGTGATFGEGKLLTKRTYGGSGEQLSKKILKKLAKVRAGEPGLHAISAPVGGVPPAWPWGKKGATLTSRGTAPKWSGRY
jgi:hypothetical protein